MQIITKAEAIGLFKSVKSCSAISLTAETPCDMNKRGNPFYGTTKLNWVAGLIGFSYPNSVNNQLGREDKEMDFEAQKPIWAVATDSRNLVTNKDGSELYVYIKVQSAGKPIYKLNGDVVEAEKVKPYLKEHTKPHTQDGLDKEIVVRMFKLSNILAFRMLGEEYVIADNCRVGSNKIATDELSKAVDGVVTI